jgi:4-amino-4-deoxy-L-arabinose transferase-like glycosyltransferase
VTVVGLAGAAALASLMLGALLAITVPYHDWDSFAFGDWSRRIAEGDWDPGLPIVAHRPLYYIVQGLLWSLTGVSFVSSRLLSLAFAMLLLVAVALLARGRLPSAGRDAAALAVALTVAIPTFSAQQVAALSDVPAAAMVAVSAAVVLSSRRSRTMTAAVAVVVMLTALTKPSTLAALAGLLLASLVVPDEPLRRRLRDRTAPVAAGLGAAFVYVGVMAARMDTGFLDFLRSGTGERWAELAAATRGDAILRLDVLGGGLRLPLAFVLIFGLARAVGLPHRRAGMIAFVLAGIATLVGPLLAGDESPFGSTFDLVAFCGFAFGLAAAVYVDDAHAPARADVVRLWLVGVPPLLVWFQAATYAPRISAAAWPGLVALMGVVLAAGVAGLRRAMPVAVAVPLLAVGVAVWVSLGSADGFNRDWWREYRSLGTSGVFDLARTTNIVLPGFSHALATVTGELADGGQVDSSDPRFSWYLPGRTRTGYSTQCSDLRDMRAFVLLVGDDSQAAMRAAGGNPDPAWWAACSAPRLRQLSDGSDGYVVFAVE